MNPRKDKVVYNLWLSKAEEASLKESLKQEIKPQFRKSNIVDIIIEAHKRGDLIKK